MRCCKETPRMTRRVKIQKKDPNASADASGHVDYSLDASWLTVGRFSCNILTRGGRERWRFNQVEAEIDRILEFRSSKKTRAMDSEYRIVESVDGTDHKYDVKVAFDRDGMREVVEAHCTEVV